MRTILLLVGTLVLILLPACTEKDPTAPADDVEHEVITSISIVLLDSVTSAVRTASWRDADGPGGAAPVADTLVLAPGRTYLGSILLLNESVTPTDTLNHEIGEQGDQHQFFYTPTGSLGGNVSIERTDRDANVPALPIGLEFKVRTSAGSGLVGGINIVLSHYEGIPKTSTPGPESDIDITIATRVQ
jgi:hypothetical protein